MVNRLQQFSMKKGLITEEVEIGSQRHQVIDNFNASFVRCVPRNVSVIVCDEAGNVSKMSGDSTPYRCRTWRVILCALLCGSLGSETFEREIRGQVAR